MKASRCPRFVFSYGRRACRRLSGVRPLASFVDPTQLFAGEAPTKKKVDKTEPGTGMPTVGPIPRRSLVGLGSGVQNSNNGSVK